ncbi:tRNA(Met) cytidine acetyltransferase [Salinigranum rubrum]|uniref:tRNA(Met) cytidine acetyltransferase TmcA n=1 Tax=Salinigranum rubrum TaxID=755307 RepID=A0A2I8VPZ3_9EURY|nr:tRNA(Met) cytidine acetyltransferase TmcA [Salinigranum rubrum]AUV83975.1 tRNA(Met) cytidine acetyltransferase [Salinigranum rubrum]
MADSSPPTSTVRALAGDLSARARATDQRRLLVLSGDRDAGWDAAFSAVDGADVDDDAVTFVTTREGVRFDRVSPARTDSLLGTTRSVVVCDAHEGFSPNLFGKLSGVVDGGGLLILLTPSLDAWPDSKSAFDESLAVPPFPTEAVTGRFRRRLVDLLWAHPGVALVEVDGDGGETVRRTGETDADVFAGGRTAPATPAAAAFPRVAYEACRTRDQSRALAALERLRGGTEAVVVEADRGRGKSSAAGLAAACLAAEGESVLVTAPRYRNAEEAFRRALELLETLGVEASHDADAHVVSVDPGGAGGGSGGGRIRFCRPAEVGSEPADVLLVDEAAALPVHLLTSFLDADRVAFFTTVHGYEGAGRGFTVRFRDRLDESEHRVTDVRLDDPIRYARGDPVESLAFRALLLDARPPVEQMVAEATPESVTYRSWSPDDLLADEHRLREVFGLLVLAHYRTEPNDLARLLDAPNLTLRALTHDGHVVSVALLAREGGLDAELRRRMYEGQRVRGNMLPDVLTSQVRDEDAAVPVGYRVMRIATHHTVRSRGLGSTLLDEIRRELHAGDPLAGRLGPHDTGEAGARNRGERPVDWLGVGYGATPALVSFWRDNGFATLYLSTSRNETSGEHSVVMCDALSRRGRQMQDRHTDWFLDRLEGTLSDPLRDLDADVVRAALGAVDRAFAPSLTDREWRVVVDASFGPGLYSVNPRPFRLLALRALTVEERPLDERQERLLVRKVLQAHPWDAVADELGFVSTGQCMKALGRAYQVLVERDGEEDAAAYRRRYE